MLYSVGADIFTSCVVGFACFCLSGLAASPPPPQKTISKELGEDNLKKIINWVLKYMSGIDIPVKR